MGWPGHNALSDLLDEVERLRMEAKRVTEKHDRLHERLTTIEKSNVDRWRDGYAAAQRQIAAWLREQAEEATGTYTPAAFERAKCLDDMAEALERGKHRDRS